MTVTSKPVLFRAKGCGSVCVEVLLRMLKVPHETVDIDYKELKTGNENDDISKLARHNPLKQLPTFVTREGAVITESEAILLHITEAYRKDTEAHGLRPFADTDARRAASFSRWMSFSATNIYAVMVMQDFPKRWIADDSSEAVVDAFQTKVEDRLFAAIKILEDNVTGPYILGDDMTILDVYVAMICQWIKKNEMERFRSDFSKLLKAILKTEEHPVVKEVWAENKFEIIQ
ncbi:hypothetical protein HDU86_005065 [Geranomyces michiganensis]|nr:hypothetical protein HDU86_005065 [Geranomyces michiganensis]